MPGHGQPGARAARRRDRGAAARPAAGAQRARVGAAGRARGGARRPGRATTACARSCSRRPTSGRSARAPTWPRSSTARRRWRGWRPSRGVYAAFDAVPAPSVAVCVGNVVGAGAEIAAGCDLRVGGDNLKLVWAGARLGAPVGPARLVPLVGLSRAKDLVLTGRVVGCRGGRGDRLPAPHGAPPPRPRPRRSTWPPRSPPTTRPGLRAPEGDVPRARGQPRARRRTRTSCSWPGSARARAAQRRVPRS